MSEKEQVERKKTEWGKWPKERSKAWRSPRWRGEYQGPGASTDWHRKRRRWMGRAIVVVGILGLIIAGGMSLLALLITRLAGGGGSTTVLVWLGGLVLALLIPMMVLGTIFRGIRGVIMPITDMLTAVEAVADGDLSVRMAERGRGDMNRLARSFNRMIEELARTEQQRRNLTADVAHELRTPLHIIQGNLEGVIDGVYEPTPDHIEATLEETRLLSRLVDDLRTLSLAEAGELPLHPEPVSVTDLLADAVTSFSGEAESRGVALDFTADLHAEHDLIQADPLRLDQVLGNLVGNALRHTPAGGTIALSARAEKNSEEDALILQITDTGEGIPEADLPFVFDRFWRGDRARTRETGSGLGLAIANQLIKAHGGQISVASTVGEGTTFTLRLPVQA